MRPTYEELIDALEAALEVAEAHESGQDYQESAKLDGAREVLERAQED